MFQGDIDQKAWLLKLDQQALKLSENTLLKAMVITAIIQIVYSMAIMIATYHDYQFPHWMNYLAFEASCLVCIGVCGAWFSRQYVTSETMRPSFRLTSDVFWAVGAPLLLLPVRQVTIFNIPSTEASWWVYWLILIPAVPCWTWYCLGRILKEPDFT